MMRDKNNNQKGASAMTKFKPGQKLSTRSTCDYDCIFSAKVISRTEKTITIRVDGENITRRVQVHADSEIVYPFGKYSMAPIFRADRA
jgi:hypothetical protein